MRVSLLMSTYDRPDALATVLRSVERQTRRPDEIVIGDDGSGPATAEVVRAASARGLPIRHCWEKHEGFRLARMRNLCVGAASGDYLIIIDDDILLHPWFVADHIAAAQPGFFVQGTRALLGEKASSDAQRADAYWPSLFAGDVANRKNLIHSPFLSCLFGGPRDRLKGTRTCNFALWRDDFIKVNGFNEDFVGWGREDSEFVTRLFNAGLHKKVLRFAALGCHLHHPARPRDGLERNDAMLRQAIDAHAIRCVNGFNLHAGAAAESGE